MKYDSPLIKFLETVANMLIVSFFWIVCSIPIVTIIPSSVALYHTSSKVIFSGRGQGVAKDFFTTFKNNFVLGIKVNCICLVATFFIVIGINTGLQIYTWSVFGLLYLILGFIITFVFVTSLVYLPAVISRFYLGLLDTFRLAIFFASQNILMSILNVILLGIVGLLTYSIHLAIMITPALYVDLVRPNIEKKMAKFITDNKLDEYEIKQEETSENSNDVSMYDVNTKFKKERKKK